MKKSQWTCAVAVLAAITLLASCAGDGGSAGSPSGSAAQDGGPEGGKVRIGIAAPAATLIIPNFALEEGLFAKEGLDDVEVTFIPGPQLVPAAAGGQVDIAIASAPAADLIAINGQKVKIAGSWILSPGQYLIAGPGITSVEDLKGKKVGINGSKGGSSSMLMSYALTSAGLSFDDVELNVLQDATSQVQAYAAGQIDAMVTFPPNINRMLVQRAGSTVIRDFSDLVFPGAQTVVNTAWAEKNPGDAKAAVRAMNAGVALWAKEPEKAKSVIATALKLTAGDPLIDELYDYTIEVFSPGMVPIDLEMEKTLFAQFRENGFPQATDEMAAKVILPDLITQALK